MRYKGIIGFLGILLFASCSLSSHKKIDPSTVSYIVLSRAGNVNFRGLTKEQQNKFIDDWNNAPSIGPCIFIGKCKIDVVFNDNSKRSFGIAGSNAKEYTVNDECYNIGDSNYFNKLWDAAQPKNEESTDSKRVRPHVHSLAEVLHDTNYRAWGAKGWVDFWFDNDTLIYNYYGQCQYSYPAKIMDSTIVVYWAFIEDCMFDIGIKKRFGLKNYPIIGKPFCKLRLINDSTLSVEYLYPEWVREFNKQDTSGVLYPNEFITEER